VPKPRTKQTECAPAPAHERRRRRGFTPQEKERILRAADACTERGELSKLLRKEGIYSSLLSMWRSAREREGSVPGPNPGRMPTIAESKSWRGRTRSYRRSCASLWH